MAETRLDQLKETIDDKQAKIGDRIHALLLLLRSRHAKEKNLKIDSIPTSPQLSESLDFSRPDPKPIYEIKSDMEIPKASSLSKRRYKLRQRILCEEIEERRLKGLCVFCEEPETPNHYLQHKNSGILMIDSEEHLSNSMVKEIGIEIPSERWPLNSMGCELENGETDNDKDRIPSDSNLVVNEVEKVKKDLVVIDVDGETEISIDQNQLIQEAKNHSTDSFHETSLRHHKNSLLKHQVSISHLEFSHRSSIECLDVYKELPSASIARQFDSLPLRTKLLRNRRMTIFSKNWCFKFKELDVRQEDIQNVLLASMLMIAIETRYATTFKDVRLMRQTHMSRRWCEVWQIQTLQDLQQFTLGEVRFQIKHKWRFKLLHLVSELNFSLESVACLSLSDDQCDHCVVVRTCCVWTTQLLFGSKGNHVWHRWKARWFFVGMISTMRAWLFGEGGFDIGNEVKEMTRGRHRSKGNQWLRLELKT